MDNRKFACVAAASFLSLLTVAQSTHSTAAKPRNGDVVVTGPRFDPVSQRRVSYADLNLAFKPGQKELRGRIVTAANDICGPAMGYEHRNADQAGCVFDAVGSTRGQVHKAIQRAKLQLAGYAVGPAIAITMAVTAR